MKNNRKEDMSIGISSFCAKIRDMINMQIPDGNWLASHLWGF